MRSRTRNSVVVLVALVAVLFCAAANAEPIFTTFNTDAGSGISASNTYTHLLDFGPPTGAAALVNTVQFDKVGPKDVLSFTGTTTQGYGFTYETDEDAASPSKKLNYHPGAGGDYVGVPEGSGMYTLLNDFSYAHGSHTYQQITLSDLTAGNTYLVKLYYRAWSVNTREMNVVFDNGDGNLYETGTFNEDNTTGMPPYYATILSFEYEATSSGSMVVKINHIVPDTGMHLYGMSNELVSEIPEPGTLALLSCGLIGLLAYAWRKRK